MIKISFEGRVDDMMAMINELPVSLRNRMTVKLECEAYMSLDQKAIEAARPYFEQGLKIPAIKAVREVNGMSLRDAKDFVESKFNCSKQDV